MKTEFTRKHAVLSPSGAVKWLNCAASPSAEQHFPNVTGKFAAEGTAAHTLAERVLLSPFSAPADFIGTEIGVDGFTFEVTAEMAEHVEKYTTLVREMKIGATEFRVEVPLHIGHVTGEEGATGTADALVLVGDVLTIVDLKFGMGVKVTADTAQCALYAIGALDEFSLVHNVSEVRVIISQPRLDHVSEHTYSLEALEIERKKFETGAQRALALMNSEPKPEDFNPGTEQCRFCRAKAVCPALEKTVAKTVSGGEFVQLDGAMLSEMTKLVERSKGLDNESLSRSLSAVELIEGWCKSIKARVESELLAGHAVPDYKLVRGRRGVRKWTDEAAAVELLERYRLSQAEVFEQVLISPAAAEKRFGKILGERQLRALSELVVQTEGKPAVAHISDPKPAIDLASSIDDFSDLDAV